MILTFNDFIKKYKLKVKETSNLKIQQVLGSIGLDKVGIFLQDGPFKTDVGIINLHQSKGTLWVLYINANYFDSYGCVPPKKFSNFIKKRYG